MRPQRPSLNEKTAAIACAVAEAFRGGLPAEIEAEVDRCLPGTLRQVVDRFNAQRSRSDL